MDFLVQKGLQAENIKSVNVRKRMFCIFDVNKPYTVDVYSMYSENSFNMLPRSPFLYYTTLLSAIGRKDSRRFSTMEGAVSFQQQLLDKRDSSQ